MSGTKSSDGCFRLGIAVSLKLRQSTNTLHKAVFVIVSLFSLILCGHIDKGNAAALDDKKVYVGINKFDLFMQYTGTASGGNGSLAYRRVTRAMAQKALDDAKDAGVKYVRVFMGGRTSLNPGDGKDSLDRWRNDPETFWSQVDEMMDDLDARGIQLVPVLVSGSSKFQVMTEEPLGEMFRNPESRSWKLLSRYVTEFVTRYRKRPTVLFYELTNELNNFAELDLMRHCKKIKQKCDERDRFTTDSMIAYTQRLADLIRSLDGSRKISSGFSIPRGSAEHLRERPQWSPSGADWRLDTREQFAKNLKDIHAAVDIISIHLYSGKNNWRFGSTDAVGLLVEAKRVADEVGKPLFVGEFGDPNPGDADERSHAVRMMNKIAELRIPYSAVWVWELYQKNTYATHDSKPSAHSLEPGYTDYLIGRLRDVNGAPTQTKAKDTQPPRVVLTWPLECSMVKKGQSIHAVASDDSGAVEKVEFLVDGEVMAVDVSLPYQADFLPKNFKAGIRRLTARAYDFAGNVAEFSSNVIAGNSAGDAGRCTVNLE